ncbi:MAG: ribosome assembly RNA-binding protein YhbY [Burkholderiales bacterium]
MLTITIEKRRALRAEAHPLSPVVMIGNAGLTDAVIKEIENALNTHELIKIRALSGEKENREAMLNEICEKIKAAPVQLIGKMLVIYRPTNKKQDPSIGTAKAKPNRRPRSIPKDNNARQTAARYAAARNAVARGETPPELVAPKTVTVKEGTVRRFASGTGNTIKHGGLRVRRKREG